MEVLIIVGAVGYLFGGFPGAAVAIVLFAVVLLIAGFLFGN